MNTELRNALRAWDQANTDSASVETGIDELGRVVRAASSEPNTMDLIRACGELIALYAAHGTDPDGDASQVVYNEATKLGYETL